VGLEAHGSAQLGQHAGMNPPAALVHFGALVLAAATMPAAAQPVTYSFIPEQTWVQFEVLHFGTSTIRGRFGPLQGQATLAREAQRGEVALRIPTASVSTGLRVFDARLREPDLLATEAHPEAFFVARQVRFAGADVAEVRGEFMLRGVSEPLSLVATRFACRTDAQGEVCGGDFEGEVRRSRFGADFGQPFIGDRVRLLVQVEGRRR
jgi:polyisoprenoid-binding protein YceI